MRRNHHPGPSRPPMWLLGAVVATIVLSGVGSRPMPARAGEASSTASAFPGSWMGRWRGPARLVGPTGTTMEFVMELEIAPTATPGRATWTLTYDGAKGRQVRPYFLVEKDAATGSYVIDEGGGVELPAQVLDGGLYGQFAVGEVRITSRDRLEAPGTADERLCCELITTRESAAVGGPGGGGTSAVTPYPVRSLQTAVLRRQPPSPK